MANGFNSSGQLQIDSLTQNVASYQTQLRQVFNNPTISVEDNERLGQLIKLIADRETKVWQAIQQVFQGWTRNGAEGVFLDEIFALTGNFRQPATSGGGDAIVQVDNTSIDSTPVTIGSSFSAENGIQYVVQRQQLVSDRVTAYRIVGSGITLGTYALRITNRTTGSTRNSSHTLASTTNAARLVFLQGLLVELQAVNPAETNIRLDEASLILYYGFDEADALTGLQQTVGLLSTPTLGNKYCLIEAIAATTGFNQLFSGQITALAPLPLGYVSVTNLADFVAGQNVETDAAFIERVRNTVDSPQSATRAAIIAGLRANVPAIQQLSFSKVVTNGIVSITPVIIGGATEDIGDELYRTQAINNTYSGTTTHTVNTEDGDTEVIRFSRGSVTELALRITYTTVDNGVLTDNEQQIARTNLTNLSEAWRLGLKVFNFSLLSAVSSAVPANTFSALSVEVKEVDQPDSAFTTMDYQPSATVLPDLLSENISFAQMIG